MTGLIEAARVGLLAPRKSFSPVWFYDEEGSRLFEAITRQPEYYPTETERALLHQVSDTIAEAVGAPAQLVELGAGSASKTRVLIDAFLRRQPKLSFSAIDVSQGALRMGSETMARAYPAVTFEPVCARNRRGMRMLDWTVPERRLTLFLGSSVGNMDPAVAAPWLREVTALKRARDAFLLGLDRDKDARTLHAAYNDEAGVTARFNLNLLTRLNRELGADFDLDAFAHHAIYDAKRRRVEMHLRSLRDQVVRVPGVGDVRFDEGELMQTENSYKYTSDMMARLVADAGLTVEHRFDAPGEAFTLLLLRRAMA